ncbi:hypothetical protein [Streptomyces sp. NPDC002082]|uniref:hypothetical protein n=1 Tax=Streptomyces sp. NPDC002082 TaxID=3154772 RepID=UPI0033307232
MREREIAGAVLLLITAGVLAASLPYTHGTSALALTVGGISLTLVGAVMAFLRARKRSQT